MSLVEDLNAKALRLGVPISGHLDITYRCNERCEHCYLDHDDKGEMRVDEIKRILDQLAESGVLFLVVSGGEPLVRHDCFEILRYARKLLFNVKLKTNALLIGVREAQLLLELGISQVQVSIYSHRAEIHDAITKVRGSLERSLIAIRRLKSVGLRITIANVLMKQNFADYSGVQALAQELGVHCTVDPTITPKINGDTAVLRMRVPNEQLTPVFRDPSLVGNVAEFCSPPAAVSDEILDGIPCSAGHTSVYISPYGDVYPCVQFPLPCGNLRLQSFGEVWGKSRQLEQVRSIRARHLHTCSACAHIGTCSRCPGLAYMEGDIKGPSSADCDNAYARTGIVSARNRDQSNLNPVSNSLVQISL